MMHAAITERVIVPVLAFDMFFSPNSSSYAGVRPTVTATPAATRFTKSDYEEAKN
jgi:hypothetical protein